MHGTMGKSLRHSEKPRSFHPESVEDEQGWLGTQSIVATINQEARFGQAPRYTRPRLNVRS